jgi:hypothetical protein
MERTEQRERLLGTWIQKAADLAGLGTGSIPLSRPTDRQTTLIHMSPHRSAGTRKRLLALRLSEPGRRETVLSFESPIERSLRFVAHFGGNLRHAMASADECTAPQPESPSRQVCNG